MLSHREVEASLLVGWLVGSLTSIFSTNTAISEGNIVTTVRVMLP